MGETSAIGGTQVEWHVLVSIVDGVAFLTLEEGEHVVLDDGVLPDSTSVGTGGLARDAVTDGEDVLEFVVLQSVAVHVNHTGVVADTGIEDKFVLLGGRVHIGTNEVSLDLLTSINVLEGGNLGVGILADGEKLPAEVDLNTTLVALLKSDLVSVREGINELVGRPVLDLGASGSCTDELVLSEEGLVVERVEVSALPLVGHGG